MDIAHYLFSFSGRINRAKQWAILLVTLVHAIIVGIIFSETIGFLTIADVVQGKTMLRAVLESPQARIFAMAFVVLYLVAFYVGCAISAKRLHDRNKSAWWLLVFIALPLVLQIPLLTYLPALFEHLSNVIHAAQTNAAPPLPPLEPPLVTITRGAATLISLWAFVELYCLSGTAGDNRFGSDPLAKRA